jgi:hypothetical protein
MTTLHRLAWFVLLAASCGAAAQSPFEQAAAPPAATDRLTALVDAQLQRLDITPAAPCSDAVFARRLFLDVLGTLPTPAEVRGFLDDATPDKRGRLIDAALARPEFADFQTMRWCDLLRVKAEFPINLWPNAVQAYARWLHDQLAGNVPYDRFAASLVLATGSNFRAPEANFLRAVAERTPAGLARGSALVWLGARLDGWPQERQHGLARCFQGVAWKNTLEWKEEIVYFDDTKTGGKPLAVLLPDGTQATVPAGVDPRTAFATWLVQEPTRWLARAHCNRVWYWLFGRGIVHEPDDLRADNPPANEALLAELAAGFVDSGWDQKQLFRRILGSAVWQRSSIPADRSAAATAQFAHQTLRRLDAEVLIDAICQITGTSEQYTSPIPEPFTINPPGTRAIDVADGSTTSAFLELFARSPRDTGLCAERNHHPTAEQSLHLLNSSHVRQKLENGRLLGRLPRGERGLEELWLAFLSRRPTAGEIEAVRAHASRAKLDLRQTASDVAWALLNCTEFLYRH